MRLAPRRILVLVWAPVILILMAGCGGSGSSIPTVAITSPADGISQTEKAVTFQVRGEGENLTYFWYFGDGSSEETKSSQITHTYAANRAYQVSVVARSAKGKESETSSISISIENARPVASATAIPSSGNAPLTVQFDGGASSDTDGIITNYEWDLGDGVTAFGPVIIHEYIAHGTYEVILRVTDNQGASASDSLPLEVKEPVLHGNLWEVRMASTDDGNFIFDPPVLKIEPGDTVRWVNVNQAHSTTAYSTANGKAHGIPRNGPSWNSNIRVAEGSIFEFTFPENSVAGSYPYFCIPHEGVGQVGIIVIHQYSEIEENFINKLPALAAQNMRTYADQAENL